MVNFRDIFSVTSIRFTVIDISGSGSAIITLRKREEHFHSLPATIISGILMIHWLWRKLGSSGFSILRRVFCSIQLAIAVKIYKEKIFLS